MRKEPLPQKELLSKIFGCTRKVYNYFLDYATQHKIYNINEWSKLLTTLKKKEEYIYLKECDKFSLQNSLKDLKAAYNNYFIDIKKDNKDKRHVRKPVFVSKKSLMQSYRTNFTNNNIEIANAMTMIAQSLQPMQQALVSMQKENEEFKNYSKRHSL